MSLRTHIASATPGEIDLFLFSLYHPDWLSTLDYAEGFEDVTVTIEDGVSTQTFYATGCDGTAAPTDPSGVDSRNYQVADLDLLLMRRIEAIVGSPTPVRVKAYWYLSSDLTQPQTYSVLYLKSPSRTGREVSFEASSVNTQDRNAPTLLFTYANSPGLRR